MWRVFHRCSIW